MQDYTRHCSRSVSQSWCLFWDQSAPGILSGTYLQRTHTQRFPFNKQQYRTSGRFCSKFSSRHLRRHHVSIAPRSPQERIPPSPRRLLSGLLLGPFPRSRRFPYRPIRLHPKRRDKHLLRHPQIRLRPQRKFRPSLSDPSAPHLPVFRLPRLVRRRVRLTEHRRLPSRIPHRHLLGQFDVPRRKRLHRQLP